MTLIELTFAILIVWFAAWLSNALAYALDIHLFLASGMTVSGCILIIQLIGMSFRAIKPNSQDNNKSTD